MSENKNSQEVADELSLGKFLQNKRLAAEIEISKASEFLKVRITDLKQLENDELDKIRKSIYAAGLIRSYAKFLKISTDEIEKKISALSIGYDFKNSKHKLINLEKENKLSPTRDSFFNFLLIAIILFLVLLLLYNSFENRDGLITNKNLVKELRKIECFDGNCR